ncbi:MAG: amidohydrolase [bacterium]
MFKKIIQVVFLSLLLLSILAGCSQVKNADLILTGGKIVTVDKNYPEAEALAVKGSKILAVGSVNDIKEYRGDNTKVIDLKGKLAIPGFIEGHGHFISLGKAMMKLDLKKAKNWSEIVSMVKKAVENTEPGIWIQGRGWHQEKWNKLPQPQVDGLPYHNRLSEVSPDNPVLLTHASGHSCIANGKAMQIAGITNKTPDPEGGEIVRDQNGVAIGVFRETAQGLISKKLSESRANLTSEELKQEQIKAIKLAEKECLTKGITSFHDAGSSFETIDLFRNMAENQQLDIRLWVMIGESNDMLEKKIDDYRLIGIGDDHLTVRSIKRFMDGALGSHGAWFLEPYTDLPGSYGLNTTPVPVIKKTAEIAIQNDFQLCIHAIGDRANREVLDIYQETFEKYPEKKDHRWRIEHAQHLHPDDIFRFGELGVIASMQAVHCTSDGPYVVKRLGKKRAEQGSYMWKDIIHTNGLVTNGTDCPVEDIDPIANFYASVTRKLKDGTEFYPEQKLNRAQTLRCYTLNCAYSAFEENIKGSLIPGKLADITVLSQDVMTVPEDEILKTEIVYTIIGGEVVYENK